MKITEKQLRQIVRETLETTQTNESLYDKIHGGPEEGDDEWRREPVREDTVVVRAWILRDPEGDWNIDAEGVSMVVPDDAFMGALEGQGNIHTPMVSDAITSYVAEKMGVPVEQVELSDYRILGTPR